PAAPGARGRHPYTERWLKRRQTRRLDRLASHCCKRPKHNQELCPGTTSAKGSRRDVRVGPVHGLAVLPQKQSSSAHSRLHPGKARKWQRQPSKSSRGLPHSKTSRKSWTGRQRDSVLECAQSSAALPSLRCCA